MGRAGIELLPESRSEQGAAQLTNAATCYPIRCPNATNDGTKGGELARLWASLSDAGGGTRTRTARGPPDFKSGASDQFRHPCGLRVPPTGGPDTLPPDDAQHDRPPLRSRGDRAGADRDHDPGRTARPLRRPRAAERFPPAAVGLRAVGGLRGRRNRDRRQSLLLADRALPRRASSAGTSGSACTRSRSSRSSWPGAATTGRRATSSRSRSSAPASRSTTC